MNQKIMRRAAAVAAVIVTVGLLAGCGGTSQPGEDGTKAETVGGFPITLENPWGTTVLEEAPTNIVVISTVDLDIALALGVEPILAGVNASSQFGEWTQDALDERGIELDTYDSSDGTDYIAIAAAAPDAILATSAWTLDDDYEKLAEIAPVITWAKDQQITDLTWVERTLLAGRALGLEERAEEVVAEVEDGFTEAAGAHPEWQGKTITYVLMHPTQISYLSYEGSDVSFFTDLGFTLPPNAAEFSVENNAVSIENIDMLDSDVLLVGYPFGEEGVLTQAGLESNALFQQLDAVKAGRYGILDDAFTSPLAYPTPINQPWVLERMVTQFESIVQ